MTGERKIRGVIFDIGRVLVRVDIARAQKGLAKGSALTPEELWSAIEKDTRWKDWQEGRMSARDWHLNLCKRFRLSLKFEEFKDVWNSAIDPEPIHPEAMFEKLSKYYKLGLLSNTDPIHVAHLERTYGFFRYFPKPVRTYSCGVGASKPEAVIFRHALQSCRVRAEEALYVDDIAAYVDAARALGCYGIHYRSPEQLATELAQVGITLR